MRSLFANFVMFHNFHRKQKQNYNLVFFIKNQFEKHWDFISKTFRSILNENEICHFSSCFIIFSYFLIVQVTVDLGTQVFADHFETTILHHFCRTSRETTSVFHVNVEIIHTHQLETSGKPSTWFPPRELVELSGNKNI